MELWIDRQAKGCRRITVFDALFEQAGDAVDLLLTDQSAVIAFGKPWMSSGVSNFVLVCPVPVKVLSLPVCWLQSCVQHGVA